MLWVGGFGIAARHRVLVGDPCIAPALHALADGRLSSGLPGPRLKTDTTSITNRLLGEPRVSLAAVLQAALCEHA